MPKPEFRTQRGEIVQSVTADEMREVDRVAVEEMGLGVLQMMENAGRSLALNCREMLKRTDSNDEAVVVLAASGGNGGGGLCCARHLHNHGVEVKVVLDRGPADLKGPAYNQYEILSYTDVGIFTGEIDADTLLNDAQLTVDALIGYGLEGRPRGRTRELIESMNIHSGSILSLDIPSGVNATTGESLGVSVSPDTTLTLALPKTGLTEVEGKVYLADIGIPGAVFEAVGVDYVSPFDEEYWVEIEPDEED
ncbi:MAG: NAD(P)H-hydrate epimerase [Halobacteria archaeon]|nr:NAD(P)H-hydrate epimerase [Halobacteria archaeon]